MVEGHAHQGVLNTTLEARKWRGMGLAGRSAGGERVPGDCPSGLDVRGGSFAACQSTDVYSAARDVDVVEDPAVLVNFERHDVQWYHDCRKLRCTVGALLALHVCMAPLRSF
jgi:hypothetical protein